VGFSGIPSGHNAGYRATLHIERFFSEETVSKANEEYKSYQNRKKKTFIIITLTSLALTLIICLLRKKTFVYKVKSD